MSILPPLFSKPPRGGQFGAEQLFGEGLLSDGPDTIIYQSLGARSAQGSPLNWLQHELEKWKRFGQDRKAMNNQSVSRERSYFQAWINVPLDKHTTAGNWLEEPGSHCPWRKHVVTRHRRHCLLKWTDVLFMHLFWPFYLTLTSTFTKSVKRKQLSSSLSLKSNNIINLLNIRVKVFHYILCNYSQSFLYTFA